MKTLRQSVGMAVYMVAAAVLAIAVVANFNPPLTSQQMLDEPFANLDQWYYRLHVGVYLAIGIVALCIGLLCRHSEDAADRRPSIEHRIRRSVGMVLYWLTAAICTIGLFPHQPGGRTASIFGEINGIEYLGATFTLLVLGFILRWNSNIKPSEPSNGLSDENTQRLAKYVDDTKMAEAREKTVAKASLDAFVQGELSGQM